MTDKQIGCQACIDAIGVNFYEKYKDLSVFAVSCDDIKGTWCFLGISTIETASKGLYLNASIDEWEYYASCYVKSGIITMDRCRLPGDIV